MPADGPSRDSEPDPPLPGPSLAECRGLSALAALPRLRRWASNWARLVLRSIPWSPPSSLDRFARMPFLTYVPPSFDFDSTLGYPGEGPRLLGVVYFWGLLQGFVFGVLWSPCHGALVPRNTGDCARLEFRKQRPLSVGRPVERTTQKEQGPLVFGFCCLVGGPGGAPGSFRGVSCSGR